MTIRSVAWWYRTWLGCLFWKAGHCFITAAVGNAQVDFKKQVGKISSVVIETEERRGNLH
jgi:hypothetical protein